MEPLPAVSAPSATGETGRLGFAGPPARLDGWLAAARPDHSRARWQDLIREGRVRVNGRPRKPGHLLKDGDAVEFDIPAPAPVDLKPEPIALDILFEDEHLLVLNKPPGLVVHPAPGHDAGTLVNALLHHCGPGFSVGGDQRPGIVHRLDRDTSGALVVAKTEAVLAGLAAQFKNREVRKQYLALAWGAPVPAEGTIETLVGRHPHHRQKMSARPRTGRPAVTHYETVQVLGPVSLLRVRIETGRTHQIRVHLAHRGHPVVGDTQYGRARPGVLPVEPGRQMLHAERLAFRHPVTGAELEFQAPIPPDLRGMLRALSRPAGE
ncbi:MAG: RluA family pseudouridine synthase [Kiritimatiellae bacterium]|nr:RluA family pseudouridine synthase [Kiritimatiellia bacterium]